MAPSIWRVGNEVGVRECTRLADDGLHHEPVLLASDVRANNIDDLLILDALNTNAPRTHGGLARRPRAPMTEPQLPASVWGKGPAPAQLNKHRRRLKQAIERDPPRPARRLTKISGSYRLNPN